MEGCHNDGDGFNNTLENLRWDTPASNQADRKKHGTGNEGEKNGESKLTASEVIEMRMLRRTKLYPLQKLADKYEVSIAMVSLIVRYKKWKHIP